MNEFTVLHGKIADFFQRFFWIRKHQDGTDLLSHLIAVDITDDGVIPLYLPLLSLSYLNSHLVICISLSRWKSILILLDRRGIQTHYTDIRKDYPED